jgi:hypothetical protein
MKSRHGLFVKFRNFVVLPGGAGDLQLGRPNLSLDNAKLASVKELTGPRHRRAIAAIISNIQRLRSFAISVQLLRKRVPASQCACHA